MLAAGIVSGVCPRQFMAGINTGNERLGNRAFLRWVRTLHTGEQDTDQPLTQLKRLQQTFGNLDNRGVCDHPNGSVASPASTAGPLQLMPKKRKKRGEPGVERIPETGSATTPEVPPGPGAQAEPEQQVTLPQEEPKETAASGENKKKKSRVQVALNSLRAAGVESFKRYVDEEITATDSLRSLRERIGRADNLKDNRDKAITVVDARLRALDPEPVLATPEAAGPGTGQRRTCPGTNKDSPDPEGTSAVRLLYPGRRPGSQPPAQIWVG